MTKYNNKVYTFFLLVFVASYSYAGLPVDILKKINAKYYHLSDPGITEINFKCKARSELQNVSSVSIYDVSIVNNKNITINFLNDTKPLGNAVRISKNALRGTLRMWYNYTMEPFFINKNAHYEVSKLLNNNIQIQFIENETKGEMILNEGLIIKKMKGSDLNNKNKFEAIPKFNKTQQGLILSHLAVMNTAEMEFEYKDYFGNILLSKARCKLLNLEHSGDIEFFFSDYKIVKE